MSAMLSVQSNAGSGWAWIPSTMRFNGAVASTYSSAQKFMFHGAPASAKL